MAVTAATAVRVVVKLVKGGLEDWMGRFWGLDGGGVRDLGETVEEEEGERRADGEKIVAIWDVEDRWICGLALFIFYLVRKFPLIQWKRRKAVYLSHLISTFPSR